MLVCGYYYYSRKFPNEKLSLARSGVYVRALLHMCWNAAALVCVGRKFHYDSCTIALKKDISNRKIKEKEKGKNEKKERREIIKKCCCKAIPSMPLARWYARGS